MLSPTRSSVIPGQLQRNPCIRCVMVLHGRAGAAQQHRETMTGDLEDLFGTEGFDDEDFHLKIRW